MKRVNRIFPEIYLKRNGVEFKKLSLVSANTSKISMTSAAEVKMSLTCTAEPLDDIDYANDTLVPYLVDGAQGMQIGEFPIVGCQIQDDGLERQMLLSGFDMTHLVQQRKIEERVYWPQGALYTTAIRERIVASGVSNILIEESDLAFATDREDWEPGTSNLTIVNDLLREIGYNTLYMSLDGSVRATRTKPATVANVSKAYSADEFSILLPGATIDIDAFDHPNVFHYSCENPDFDEPLYAYAENNELNSRFSISRAGRIPVFRSVDNVASQQALQDLADKERLESMYSVNEIKFQTGLVLHDPFEVIALDKAEFSGVISETSWSMTLSHNGVMEHSGKQGVYF